MSHRLDDDEAARDRHEEPSLDLIAEHLEIADKLRADGYVEDADTLVAEAARMANDLSLRLNERERRALIASRASWPSRPQSALPAYAPSARVGDVGPLRDEPASTSTMFRSPWMRRPPFEAAASPAHFEEALGVRHGARGRLPLPTSRAPQGLHARPWEDGERRNGPTQAFGERSSLRDRLIEDRPLQGTPPYEGSSRARSPYGRSTERSTYEVDRRLPERRHASLGPRAVSGRPSFDDSEPEAEDSMADGPWTDDPGRGEEISSRQLQDESAIGGRHRGGGDRDRSEIGKLLETARAEVAKADGPTSLTQDERRKMLDLARLDTARASSGRASEGATPSRPALDRPRPPPAGMSVERPTDRPTDLAVDPAPPDVGGAGDLDTSRRQP